MRVRRNAPAAINVLAERLEALGGAVAKAGWFKSSRYEDGTPVASVAYWQENGVHTTRYGSKAGDYTVVIPPRPFMRPTVDRMRDRWLAMLKAGAKEVIAGKKKGREVLDLVGLNAAGEIARSITLVHEPPLKPSTVRARLRKRADKHTVGLLDKPLEDTMHMIGTVTHVVEGK